MFSCITLNVLLGTLLIIATIPDAASYSKYGRTCKDIGCPSDQVCVMAEDPCSGYGDDKCGRYPTCRKTSDVSCSSMVCGNNEYCKSENGSPQCVRKTAGSGYESAGVSYVNGERVNGERVAGNNANPYANANAPPAPADPAGGYHRTSGSNLGYPPYPSNSGSSSSSGYPSYPQSTNQAGHHRDLGYPTQNRMPMPGQQPGQQYPGYPQQSAGYPANYPQYPGYQNQPGYPNYPNQYPNQNQQRGYGYNTNSIYRRNGASTFTSATILVGLTGLLLLLETTL